MTYDQMNITLNDWHFGLRVLHKCNFECAKILERRKFNFGVLNMIITSAVGTSVLSSVCTSEGIWCTSIIAVFSFMATVLASLQTFLNYGGRAEKHKAAGVKYGTLRREIEETLVFCAEGTCSKDFMTSIRKRWDTIDMESPTVPVKTYDTIYKSLKHEEKKSKEAKGDAKGSIKTWEEQEK